ncbi:MAG: SPOR domain-containing protein [Candidatus Marinimicrobia bacterium]|nr:SPOR domain-containing protein [Candidatus Neomarinimicrobiota bacterium]MCH8068237.1 SPOR domain-containing protein [Candidatus Neomarinimicrobiota bacterium]
MLKQVVQFGLILIVVSFYFSCEKTDVHTGSVGNYFVIKAKAPMGIEKPTFDWIILGVPQSSQLGYSDLILEEGKSRMTFSADEHGEYLFELVIYDSVGDEIASQKYLFKIDKPEYADIDIQVAEKGTTPAEIDTEQITKTGIQPDTLEPETVVVVSKEMVEEEYIEYALLTEEEATPEEKDEVPTKISTEAQQAPPVISQPPAYDRYTIQVSSWDNPYDAKREMNKLVELGFDAYIQRVYFSELDELWYRIRIGAFEKYSAADKAAKQISGIIQKTTWVDNVRLEY